MSRADIVVILGCLVAGYWAVSFFMSTRDEPPPSTRPRTDEEPGRGSGPRSVPEPEPARAGDAPRERPRVTLMNWYRILGVREAATREEIVAAYKKLISQYHPDKVAQMGEEIRAVAEAKTQDINAAYEIGMRLFRT